MIAVLLSLFVGYLLIRDKAVCNKSIVSEKIDIHTTAEKDRSDLYKPILFTTLDNPGMFVNQSTTKPLIYSTHNAVGEYNPFLSAKNMHGYLGK